MLIEDKEIARLRSENESLRMLLDETKQLAAVKEKVLKTTIAEHEWLYDELSAKFKEVRKKGYEIRVLNALNEIIATASRHIELNEILGPTLAILTRSVEELIIARGRKVKITGGLFLLEKDRLTLAAIQGIEAGTLGCGGAVATGECVCGMAASSREIVHTPYCLKDPRHTFMHPGPAPEEHAHISIPLKSGDKVCGVIFLYVEPAGYIPEAADIVIFTSIGNYLGMHIEKARLYAVVQGLAMRDGLTGLYNHREFEKHLSTEVQKAGRYSKTFSLLLMDIDHFKRVNDAHGHQFGNEVLRDIGAIIGRAVRFFDIAARYGGEEFCVILPDTPLDGALRAAERLRANIASHPFGVESKSINVTVSIGVASFTAEARDGAGLVRLADKALYRAKEEGRNRVCAL